MWSDIQRQLFADQADEALYHEAAAHVGAYAAGARDRNVAPTQEAVAALAAFDQALPETPRPARATP